MVDFVGFLQNREREGATTVRLPEDRIKEAILSNDLDVRQRAVRFFARSFSSDTSIMPLVIKAVETFGREDAYHLIGLSRHLPQTESTIAWIIDELNDEQSDRYENYTYNLSMVLANADPALLLRKESAILDCQHFSPGCYSAFSERLQMLSWDEATCWQELEAFCEEGKDKQYTDEVNLGYANRIVEALARYGDDCEEKVHALLRHNVEDFHHNSMKWMEPLIVRLAGETHLESTVPLLVSKLIEDRGDLLNEKCATALSRIGTSAVLEAVAETYPAAPHHFRLYATEPLEYIHSNLATEKCLHLLRQEKDNGIRVYLAHALLSHFAQEGIEESRVLLMGQELDFESRGLRNYLVETCTIMGERFPEYDEWRAAEKTEKEEHWERAKELENDPAGLIQFALEKMTGKTSAAALKQESPVSRQLHLNHPLKTGSKQKVGRNDPCPCGSGKKFKKCCMNKSEGNPLFN
jgi:uncharacterized protein YchJ